MFDKPLPPEGERCPYCEGHGGLLRFLFSTMDGTTTYYTVPSDDPNDKCPHCDGTGSLLNAVANAMLKMS